MTTRTALTRTYTTLVNSEAKTATAYLSPTLVLRITRQGTHQSRDRRQTYLVTVGQPNHAARAFIRQCRKAGEPFPVRKVQLTGRAWKRKRARGAAQP